MQIVFRVLEFIQKNSVSLIFFGIVLVLLLMLQYVRQLKKIRRKMDLIDKNIGSHFEKMMEESAQSEVEIATEMKRQQEAFKEVLQRKEKQQQEAVFDAVLQEIFP